MNVRTWHPEHTLVILATLLAAVLRFSSLGQLPPQAWIDEVWVSARAYELIQTGKLVANYGAQARGGGGDAGLVWLAVLPELLGIQSLVASRVVTAAAGTLAVPVAYACFKELFAGEPLKRRRRLALLAAGALSYLPYQTILSRVGMEAGSMPVMYLFCVWQVQRGLRRGAWSGWILAGLVGGTMQYAGLHTRFVLPVMAFMIVQAFLAAPSARRREIVGGTALLGVIGTTLCLWLIVTYVEHPAYFFTRSQIVMGDLFYRSDQGPALTLVTNVLKMLGSFNFIGDDAPRHNVPLMPMLDVAMSFGFFVGVVWCLIHIRRSALARLLLAWLLLLVIPSALTAGAPNYERTSGIVGAPIGLLAVGWGVISERVRSRAEWPRFRQVGITLAGLMVAASISWNIYSVFVRWPQTPTLNQEFMVGTAEVLHTLVRQAPVEPVYADVILGRIDPPLFALGFKDSAVRRVSLQDCLPLADGAPTTTTYVINSDRNAVTDGMLTDIYPNSRRVLDKFRMWEEGSITEIAVPAGAHVPRPAHQPRAEFEGGISLYGYDWSKSDLHPGGALSITIYWHVTRPVPSDLTSFFHVQPMGSGEVPPLAQHDQSPCASTFPTSAWLPATTIMDWFEIPLPTDLAPGAYELLAGWYDSTSHVRSAVVAADQATQSNRVVIGTFEITSK